MTLSPGLRKLALTAHVASSVGWLGSVAAFLALAIAGLITSADDRLVRAAYLGTEVLTWAVIVPLAFASLVTGLIVSLGTPWGLFEHYWVVIKLLLSTLATVLLLVHTHPIALLAAAARDSSLWPSHLQSVQVQLVADATAAAIALIVNVTLSIYKPQGLTAYGWRKRQKTANGGKL